MTENNNKVLVAMSDLFFAVQILDSAKRAMLSAEIVKTQEELREKAKLQPAMIIFDLNFAALDPVGMIGELSKEGLRTIAFVSHVQSELKQAALDAGCDVVLARSAFAQNLPQLLQRYTNPA